MTPTDQEKNTTTTDQGTCHFLRLPIEVRNMIYHYHLTSQKILPRHQSFRKRWSPINLLYIIRQIYDEAFYHLYTKGEFVLTVRPESIFGLATCWGISDVNANNVSLGRFIKNEKTLHLLRHIALDIHWPSREYPLIMDRGRSPQAPTTDHMLKQTMAAVGTMLARLPALRFIDVSWSQMMPVRWECVHCSPPFYKIPGWLRGLKRVRRSNERVDVRMPVGGVVSTEELRRDQEDLGLVSNTLRELLEDSMELLGILREMRT